MLSIIIPVYNVDLYLTRCLDSVLAQTFQDFEIICIDDASTDDSYRILREYAEKDSRIRILRNEQNKGLSYTRNTGLEHAQGEYVYFLDSDDAITPDCIAKISGVAEDTDADIVVFGAIEKEGEKQISVYTFPNEVCNRIWDGKKLFTVLHKTIGFVPPVQFKLWRRDFLAKAGLRFYEGIYHEDELFYFEALMNARKVTCIPDLLYFYYRREGSIMRRKIEFRHIASLIVIINEMQRLLNRNEFDSDVNDAILKQIATFSMEAEQRMALFGFKKLPTDSELFDSSMKAFYDILRYMAQNQYRYFLYKEDWERFKSFEHVLVYGAGQTAREILLALLEHNVSNIEIVVSVKKENEHSLLGFPVREINSLVYPKEKCIVVIAVGNRFKEEVESNAKKLGYRNVFLFENS